MRLHAKRAPLTKKEKLRLYRLETEHSNASLTDAHDIPRRRNSRRANRVTHTRGHWVITADKIKGGRFYYAGGARLTSETKDALVFPSFIHAFNVKNQILSDFPKMLTKHYHWQAFSRR